MDDRGCLDRGGARHRSELVHAGGRSFEIRSNAMERGGQVIGFTDVTDMLRAQAALRETAETLERRVAERTADMEAEGAGRGGSGERRVGKECVCEGRT